MLEGLMQRLRQGDNSALDRIYLETKNSVYAICYSYTKNPADAQDLMQDTYVNIMRYILHYNPGSNPKAWILQIAKNLCINFYKKRKREISIDISHAYQLADSRGVVASDESGIIKLASKILDKKELRIVLLYTIADMTHAEISKVLKINSSTVRWKYRNALNKLRKQVKKEDIYG